MNRDSYITNLTLTNLIKVAGIYVVVLARALLHDFHVKAKSIIVSTLVDLSGNIWISSTSLPWNINKEHCQSVEPLPQ